jgi:hypothetical protein
MGNGLRIWLGMEESKTSNDWYGLGYDEFLRSWNHGLDGKKITYPILR